MALAPILNQQRRWIPTLGAIMHNIRVGVRNWFTGDSGTDVGAGGFA